MAGPDFGRMCVAVLALRGMVSIAVPVPEVRVRMNFFSPAPGAFDHFDVDGALRLAELAAPAAAALADKVLIAQSEAEAGECSRVAVALGTVMAQYRVGPSDGFALLQEAVRDLDCPLFFVALDVIQDGRLPEEAIMRVRRQRHNRQLPRQESAGSMSIGGPDVWRTPPVDPSRSAPSRRGSDVLRLVPGPQTRHIYLLPNPRSSDDRLA